MTDDPLQMKVVVSDGWRGYCYLQFVEESLAADFEPQKKGVNGFVAPIGNLHGMSPSKKKHALCILGS